MNASAKPMVVLVTGAASGMGRACARKLIAEGHEIVALDLADAALKATFPEDSARLLRFAGDVSRAESCQGAVQAAVARFGRLDAVTHWAAAHSTTFWTDLGAEEFNRILSVNVTGAFLIAQAAGEHMRRRGTGSIVLTSSTSTLAGAMGGKTGSGGPAYVASKSAIIGLVRTLANALGREGVRVNAVAPGVVDTPMIDTYSPEHRAAQPGRVPLGRIGSPEEIADVACFLISDAARYINGETIIVNGGANFG
ncbi:MAG: SDR family oxidoreductase [Betaproteobacteria bacterium]|nr:SDR family oxidoreductase [Betaproteobacteria bacterium]